MRGAPDAPIDPEQAIAYMQRALALAERGRGRTTPNPMVGAVIVDPDGVVVGRGAHEAAGGPHAEIHAIANAGSRTQGATLYCTLEPCCHTGRTGPCAPRIVDAGIRRVVIATEDPNPLVAGRGTAYLRAHGVDVTLGVCAGDAARLNRGFFTRIVRGRPFVTMKVAQSLDGCVAAGPGLRTQLTGAVANRHIHRERAEVDAIAVGSGTVLVDDPLLTVRGIFRYRPLTRVVLDRRLRTPATARLLSTVESGPVIIVTEATSVERQASRARELTAAGAIVEALELKSHGASFLSEALRRLARSGINSLIVEGGPTLHEAFWREGAVDRIEIFLAPTFLRPGGVPWNVTGVGTIAALRETTVAIAGEDVRIEGYVHRTD